MQRWKWAAMPIVVLLGCPRTSYAGMPSIGLTEVAAMRLSTISFFVVGLLLSAWVVGKVWNSLARDFPRLPRLSYKRALSVVVLWGLLFIIVLTMISGARELMTPGAWEKDGLTYKLPVQQAPPSDPDERQILARRQEKLVQLAEQLLAYAAEHSGQFPSQDDVQKIPESYWQVDGKSGLRFVYVPGRSSQGKSFPLAYEPQVVDDRPFVVMTSGVCERLEFDEVIRRLPPEATP